MQEMDIIKRSLERHKLMVRNAGHLLSIIAELPCERHNLVYTNYAGKTSLRDLSLVQIWYGNTAWHHESQLMLKASDHEKNAIRDFAVADFKIYEK